MLVETRLGRIFCEARGQGEPLLLWHSLLCDSGMWRFTLPVLEAHFRVVLVDAPGHGRSAPVHAPYTLDDCAQVGVDVLDALDIERAHWAGLSWGGMTGMRVALHYPERLRRLALIDTSADRERRRKLPSYHAMVAGARLLGSVDPFLDKIETLFFTKATCERERAVVEQFREHLSRMPIESLRHAVDAVIFSRRDIRERLPEIAAPTLVVVGAEDVATPPARAREIANGIPGATLLEVPGAAHLSVLERPDVINGALLAHLSGPS